MNVKQVYTLVNDITKEIIGDTAVVKEDLSNVVDVGQAIADAQGVDNFVKSLADHIGKMVFVDRVYSGRAPSVLMDSWEFGSIKEKISMDLPTATENKTWELTDGTSYDPNVFYKPTVSATFWNERVTFEVDMSITQEQVKSAFDNATQMNSFVSMIYTAIANTLTIKLDGLIMSTINNMIAETVYADYKTADLGSKSGIKAVNMLKLYNDKYSKTLTASTCLNDLDFIRFSACTMSNYIDRLKVISKLFNIGGKDRFTPADRLHCVMLSEFKNSADVYLQSQTFHDNYTALPNAETVTYWQGSGTEYGFASTSSINVKSSAGHEVSMTGILGVLFDTDALGVSNLNRRVTTQVNQKAEFYNQFHKVDVAYFNDTNENMVVFFVADATASK